MLVQSDTFTNLVREKYISLTTFRKAGEAVVTPMWFAESFGLYYFLLNTILAVLRKSKIDLVYIGIEPVAG